MRLSHGAQDENSPRLFINSMEVSFMNALLILNNDKVENLRVIVCLEQKTLKERVISLLEEDRGKEAFEILKTKAEFREYLPRGHKPHFKPEVTLFEDML